MQLLDQNAICYKTVSLHGTTEIQYNTNINVFFFLIETEIAQVKKLTSTLTLIYKNNNVIKKKKKLTVDIPLLGFIESDFLYVIQKIFPSRITFICKTRLRFIVIISVNASLQTK